MAGRELCWSYFVYKDYQLTRLIKKHDEIIMGCSAKIAEIKRKQKCTSADFNEIGLCENVIEKHKEEQFSICNDRNRLRVLYRVYPEEPCFENAVPVMEQLSLFEITA